MHSGNKRDSADGLLADVLVSGDGAALRAVAGAVFGGAGDGLRQSTLGKRDSSASSPRAGSQPARNRGRPPLRKSPLAASPADGAAVEAAAEKGKNGRAQRGKRPVCQAARTYGGKLLALPNERLLLHSPSLDDDSASVCGGDDDLEAFTAIDDDDDDDGNTEN